MKWNSINYLKVDFLKNPALILFTIASIASVIYFLAGTYEREVLILIAKSLIAPSIILYYIQRCKKIENSVIILFFIFFSADIIIITSPENSLSWIISIYILGYLAILYHIIKDLKQDVDTVITRNKVYNIIILLFFYFFIYFQFIDFIFVLQFEYKPLYLVASVLILVILIVASISCVLKQSLKKWILILAILMLMISSFVYVCQIYFIEIESLYFWALMTQSFFYFLMINYFLINNKKEATN